MTGGIERAACVGGGLIGSGWAARFVLSGIDVSLYDPGPDAASAVQATMDNAERAFDRLFGNARPAAGALSIAGSLAEAVEGAGFIQESVLERLDLKRRVLAEIDAAAPAGAVVASSTSGLLPSVLQEHMQHPERMLVGHPFNPVYLLPLVEVAAGRRTAPETVERACAVYAGLGMKPLVLRKEIDAFIADRLQEALWREALWLVHDGVATVGEIDDAMRYSFGLRWAQMGVFQTYRLAGGEAGMRHFMEQFGPCLAWPWTKLTDVPEFDEALIDTIAEQSDRQAEGLSIRGLERIRDDNLIAIMEALERCGPAGWGAGALLAEAREAMRERRPPLTTPWPGRNGADRRRRRSGRFPGSR